MQELTQVLQYEQKKKDELEDAKARASQAIQQKEEEISSALENFVSLTIEEKKRLVGEKDKIVRDMESSFREKLRTELTVLEKKGESNFSQAVDCLVAEFLDCQNEL